MTSKIETQTARIVAEKIGMPVDEVDPSYVSHILETWGTSAFPEDQVAQIIENRDGDRIEAIYRVGRRYYVRRWHHGFSESADWRSIHPTTALMKIEERLDDDEEDGRLEPINWPDDPDSIEELLLPVDE